MTGLEKQSVIDQAIQKYFADRQDDELLRLRWENEYMSRLLRDREESEINAAVVFVRTATAAQT